MSNLNFDDFRFDNFSFCFGNLEDLKLNKIIFVKGTSQDKIFMDCAISERLEQVVDKHVAAFEYFGKDIPAEMFDEERSVLK